MLFREGDASKFLHMKIPSTHRCLPIVLLALSVLVPLSGQEAPTNKGQRYDSRALSNYLDGDLYMMQEEYAQAAGAYERALLYDSTSATIYLSLAEALMQDNRPAKARRAGERALHLQPDDPLVHKFLFQAAAAQHNFAEAIEHLDDWAKLDPTDIDPLFRKAGILYRQKEFSQVIDTYLAIYDRDPMQHQVLSRAGEMALTINDLDRAFQVYQQLYRREPDDPQVARAYAEISMQTRHYDEAATVYERLNQAGAASLSNRMQLAWLYWQQQEPLKAKELLDGLIEEGHRQWEILSMAGRLASEMTDYVQLAKVSHLMIEVYPDSTGGYTGLAIGRVNLDDESGAIAILEKAALRFQTATNVNYLLGNLYFGAERYTEAEQSLITALTQAPDARRIKFLLASTWSSLEKFGRSDSLFEELLQADEKDATVMNNYAYSIAGREQLTKKQLKYARKLSRRSLKLRPDNAAFLDTYGWIWYRLGRYRKAGKYVNKSI
ncbi:MAG: tetratricopeptide repeat protein, partial [Candidatus Marinimicrobia bacterium]|nr:tetratricopeptide repeat protein [Candidatus Neomarinimicrobiota bacterium]